MAQRHDHLSDGAIVAAVLAGQPEQFVALVHRYQTALLRAAISRLKRADWAEDVVQETFLCAFRWLSSYDSRYSFRTWLWTILLNQCHRAYRRRERHPRLWLWSQVEKDAAITDASQLPARELGPLSQLMAKERGQRIERLLDALPEPQADSLRLRFFGGLKFQEIADAMGCSLSTAKNRVRWGLVRLSELLNQESAIDESLNLRRRSNEGQS